MSASATQDLRRVCVKVYAPEPGIDEQVFVPIFHEWIRERAFDDLVLFDVADYAHVPESPGIVLVTHEAHFSLDRSDGRFGLHTQRRVDGGGDAVGVLAETIGQTLRVAERLAADSRTGGALRFETGTIRVEANDRLRAPNTDEGWVVFEPLVREAAVRALGGSPSVVRVANDPRDRLSADIQPGAA